MWWFSHLVANILILSFMFATTNADDNNAACNHETQLVKVKNWVDGKEGDMLNAMTAKFGSILPKLADQSLKYPLISSIPADCCSPSTSKLSGSVAVCVRGNCDYTTKATLSQSVGATAVLMINEKLVEMDCPKDTTEKINISIPVVEVTEEVIDNLNKILKSGKRGWDFNF